MFNLPSEDDILRGIGEAQQRGGLSALLHQMLKQHLPLALLCRSITIDNVLLLIATERASRCLSSDLATNAFLLNEGFARCKASELYDEFVRSLIADHRWPDPVLSSVAERLIHGSRGSMRALVLIGLLEQSALYRVFCASSLPLMYAYSEDVIAEAALKRLDVAKLDDERCVRFLERIWQFGDEKFFFEQASALLRDERFARLTLTPSVVLAAVVSNRARSLAALVELDEAAVRRVVVTEAFDQSGLALALRRRCTATVGALLHRRLYSDAHVDSALQLSLELAVDSSALLLLERTTSCDARRLFELAICNCGESVTAALLKRFGGNAIDLLLAFKPIRIRREHLFVDVAGPQVTPLTIAVLRNHAPLVRVLRDELRATKSSDLVDSEIQSTIGFAVRDGYIDVLKCLLPKINISDSSVATTKNSPSQSFSINAKDVFNWCRFQSPGVPNRLESLLNVADVAQCIDCNALLRLFMSISQSHRNESFELTQKLIERCGERVDVNILNECDNSGGQWTLDQHMLVRGTVLSADEFVLGVLRRRDYALDDDVALTMLVEAIRFNRSALCAQLLANAKLDTSRRVWRAPPRNRLLRVAALPAEVAIDYGRYDVLQQLMQRAEFRASVDNNALLRALCGLDGVVRIPENLVLDSSRSGGIGHLYYDAAPHDDVLEREKRLSLRNADFRSANKMLELIDRLLRHATFESVPGSLGSLDVLLCELVCEDLSHNDLQRLLGKAVGAVFARSDLPLGVDARRRSSHTLVSRFQAASLLLADRRSNADVVLGYVRKHTEFPGQPTLHTSLRAWITQCATPAWSR